MDIREPEPIFNKDLVSDPEIWASTLLGGGTLVWRGVSAWANVDFLLSIREERFAVMFDFFESTAWWITVLAAIIWALFRVLHKRKNIDLTMPGWPLLLSSNFIVFLFGVLLAVHSSGGVPSIITSWGSTDLQHCVSTVETSRLMSFQDKYKLAMFAWCQILK